LWERRGDAERRDLTFGSLCGGKRKEKTPGKSCGADEG
jgi:hypothetical protein